MVLELCPVKLDPDTPNNSLHTLPLPDQPQKKEK